jgi:hypothetical protein
MRTYLGCCADSFVGLAACISGFVNIFVAYIAFSSYCIMSYWLFLNSYWTQLLKMFTERFSAPIATSI